MGQALKVEASVIQSLCHHRFPYLEGSRDCDDKFLGEIGKLQSGIEIFGTGLGVDLILISLFPDHGLYHLKEDVLVCLGCYSTIPQGNLNIYFSEF